MKRVSMPSRPAHSMTAIRTSSTEKSSMPFRADSACRRKFSTLTPGISSGCWNPRNRPRLARSLVDRPVASSPSNRIRPAVTS